MNDELIKRIKDAAQLGVKIRSEYFSLIDLPDEQLLGAPADAHAILCLENRIERELPESYKAFLRLYNGWKMVDGSMDLISVEDQLNGEMADEIYAWQADALKSGDLVAGRSLVIGVSRYTPTRLLLDPDIQNESKEWRVVQHYHEEEGDYDSFIVWLEESICEFKELIKEEETGEAQ